MKLAEKFMSADLDPMPDDGKRYEVIEGELHVPRQPGWNLPGGPSQGVLVGS